MSTARDDAWPDLALPVICAPMFRVSGVELVLGACRAGVIGAFPSLNARTSAQLDEWLRILGSQLKTETAPGQRNPAPIAVNLIVHRTNKRLEADLAVCAAHRVPLVISSVGDPAPIVRVVKDYGGQIYHDVATVAHARKAAAAGVDGLVLLCAGAGGQTGTLNPFAFMDEVRRFWPGRVVLSGGIATGHAVRAVRELGADLAYIGTFFMASKESMASEDHKRLLVASGSGDVVVGAGRFGALTSLLRSTVEGAGIQLRMPSGDIPVNMDPGKEEAARWELVKTAGQGVGMVRDIVPVASLVERLAAEYRG